MRDGSTIQNQPTATKTMNSGFKALFNTIGDGLTSESCIEANAPVIGAVKMVAEAPKQEKKVDGVMSLVTGLALLSLSVAPMVTGLLNSGSDTDTGANYQKIELAQIKAA